MKNKIVKLYRKFVYSDISPVESDLEEPERPEKEFLTLSEASTYTSLVTSAIMYLIELGELPVHKGLKGPLFKVDDLDALINELIIVEQWARISEKDKQAEDDTLQNLKL